MKNETKVNSPWSQLGAKVLTFFRLVGICGNFCLFLRDVDFGIFVFARVDEFRINGPFSYHKMNVAESRKIL